MTKDSGAVTSEGRMRERSEPRDAQTPGALDDTYGRGIDMLDNTDSRAEVQVRLEIVQRLLGAALDGKLGARDAITRSVRLLTHAKDFLPGDAA